MKIDKLEDMGTVLIEDFPSCRINYSYNEQEK